MLHHAVAQQELDWVSPLISLGVDVLATNFVCLYPVRSMLHDHIHITVRAELMLLLTPAPFKQAGLTALDTAYDLSDFDIIQVLRRTSVSSCGCQGSCESCSGETC